MCLEGGEAAGLERLRHYLWDTDAASSYLDTRNSAACLAALQPLLLLQHSCLDRLPSQAGSEFPSLEPGTLLHWERLPVLRYSTTC